jgi:O-antigen ligase
MRRGRPRGTVAGDTLVSPAPPRARSLSRPFRSLGVLWERVSLGALVLSAALPVLFLHEQYQPTLGYVSSLEIRLSDVAVLLIVVAALVSAARYGSSRLGPGRAIWIPGAALLVWLALQAFRPASLDDARFEEHLVTYLKFGEYALLALAVPLLLRSTRDLSVFLGAVVLWGAVASGVALAQFFGLDVFGAWSPGWRQPSFLGHHDLAGLSAMPLGLAAAAIVCGRTKVPAASLFPVAVVSGALGTMIAGSVAALAGLALGAIALLLVARSRFTTTRRRVLALILLVATLAAGVTAIRADNLEQFVRFIGVRGDEAPEGVETYSQRTVLAYIGLRIVEDNAVLGVGWQRSSRAEVFAPYIDDARRRFPDVTERTFPAPGREWGIQNVYIQMLADAGIVGFVLLLALGVGAIMLAVRAARHGPTLWATGAGLTVLWTLLTFAGEWASLGIVAGLPIQAATCLVLGLAAAGAATAEDETAV